MTATFSHRKTVMARTAKKEDTPKLSQRNAVLSLLSRSGFHFRLLAAGAAASAACSSCERSDAGRCRHAERDQGQKNAYLPNHNSPKIRSNFIVHRQAHRHFLGDD